MTKFLTYLAVAAALCGCASHLTTPHVAPLVSPRAVAHATVAAPPQVTSQAVAAPTELTALHQFPATLVPLPVTNVVSPVAPAPLYIIWRWYGSCIGIILVICGGIYGLPLLKKLLAWVKSKDTVTDLKTISTKAVAITPVEPGPKGAAAPVVDLTKRA